MLIEFRVGNYRSFNEPVTLSMLAADISSKPEELDTNNCFQVNSDVSLLTSAVIYGANASGKSNLIRALHFMRGFVLSSTLEQRITDGIDVAPFLLNTATIDQPSSFEVVFRVDETQYRYGFEVTKQQVISEWLYYLSSSRESTCFTRNQEDGIKVSPRNFREGKGLEKHTRDNALFLSVVAQFNGDIAKKLLRWFGRLIISTGIDDRDFFSATLRYQNSSYRDAINDFIKQLDIGITGFTLEKTSVHVPETVPPFLSPEIAEKWQAFIEALKTSDEFVEHPKHKIKTLHQRFDETGKAKEFVAFDLEQESDGTQRLFAFAEPIIHALNKGRIVIIDELDARIHPNLVIALLRLFNSSKTNPNHAQIIFATHNTNILSSQLFRRDQVWFVEKTRWGESDLYALVEYRVEGKKVRNDASFEKGYIEGRYGAIPFLGDLEQVVGAVIEQEATAG
jgi:AAA15 family ATPase/GTPase